jgi:AcrR family transcriptional regulator
MTSLDPATPPVNPPRRYDSARRRQQAERSRRAVIDTARELFLRDGYGATTIAAIARAADVSPESIYKGFGSKPGLLRAIRETALGGAGTVPAERRSDAALETETDPRAIFATWALLATEVAPRVAPVLLLVGAAAAVDPTLVPLEREMD